MNSAAAFELSASPSFPVDDRRRLVGHQHALRRAEQVADDVAPVLVGREQAVDAVLESGGGRPAETDHRARRIEQLGEVFQRVHSLSIGRRADHAVAARQRRQRRILALEAAQVDDRIPPVEADQLDEPHRLRCRPIKRIHHAADDDQRRNRRHDRIHQRKGTEPPQRQHHGCHHRTDEHPEHENTAARAALLRHHPFRRARKVALEPQHRRKARVARCRENSAQRCFVLGNLIARRSACHSAGLRCVSR